MAKDAGEFNSSDFFVLGQKCEEVLIPDDENRYPSGWLPNLGKQIKDELEYAGYKIVKVGS